MTNQPQECSDDSATRDVAEIPETEAYANVGASTRVLPYSLGTELILEYRQSDRR